VVVKSGQKQDEKAFLGYEFSERRGYEGIKLLPGGTKLFDEDGALNPQKVNSYIYNAFLNEPPAEVDEAVAKHVSYGRMSGFFEYGTRKFDKRVNLSKKAKFISIHPLIRLANFVEAVRGVTYDKDRDQVYEETDNVILTADNITIDGKLDIVKRLYLRSDIQLDASKKLHKGDVFICLSSGSKEHVGKCVFIPNDMPCFAGGFMGILRKINNGINMKYLSAILSSDNFRATLSNGSTGANINNLSNQISDIKIPLPPLDIQRRIVAEVEALEREETAAASHIAASRNDIVALFDKGHSYAPVLLSQIAVFNPPKSEIAEIADDTQVSFVEMASVSNDGFIASTAVRKLGETRKGGYTYFRDNDIIIAKITPCMENGKCALASHLKNEIGMGSTEFHVVRCGDKIVPKYLFAFLNRQSIRDAAKQQMTGASGHRRVPVSFYKQLNIFLPPLKK
jgi:type I restriction enzyme M protein